MSRALNDLSPRMKPLAIELIARCVEQGIMVLIVDTLRTPEEQAANVKKGVSWTLNSKHLTGDAIDICPYEIYQLGKLPDKLAWDGKLEVWQKIGAIGESVGLVWGGRWNKTPDPGHFEITPQGRG